MQVENQAEKLRLESVANIVQGADVESQIAYRQATGELNRAQADTLRAQQPYIAQKMLAEIDASKALTEERQQQTLRGRTLLPEEVKSEQARQRASNAQAAASDFQVRRGQELLQFEKDRITADINRDNAAAGYSQANQARIEQLFPLEKQELQNKIDEYVTMEMGDKQTFKMRGPALVNEINELRARQTQSIKEHEALKRQARQDESKARETAAKYENHIKQRAPGGYKMGALGDEELGPDVDMFHSTSRNPYVYILQKEPGTIYGSTPRYKRFDLPKKADGTQLTARAIYEAAEAEQGGMTVQQYLEQVLYPYLQQPVPWNTAVTRTLPAK